MMVALIRKDARNVLGAWIGGVALSLIPPLVALIFWLSEKGVFDSAGEVNQGLYTAQVWRMRVDIAGSSVLGIAAAAFGFAAAASSAFAKERADRTSQFMDSLPIARWRVVLSKFMVVLLAALAPWVLGLTLAHFVAPSDPHWSFWTDTYNSPVPVLWPIAKTCIFVFGVNWLLSASTRSSVVSWAIATGGAILILISVPMIAERLTLIGDTREQFVSRWYGALLGGLGGAGFIAGTLVALLRRTF